MVDNLPERDDDRFEEVLGRLDALVRRGQPETDPPPPPSISEASIPVLTEVYRLSANEAAPATVAGPFANLELDFLERKIDEALVSVLPEVIQALGDSLSGTLQRSLDEALKQGLEELRPKAEALLRQHLDKALARDKGQTEI